LLAHTILHAVDEKRVKVESEVDEWNHHPSRIYSREAKIIMVEQIVPKRKGRIAGGPKQDPKKRGKMAKKRRRKSELKSGRFNHFVLPFSIPIDPCKGKFLPILIFKNVSTVHYSTTIVRMHINFMKGFAIEVATRIKPGRLMESKFDHR
jgi:hypothetical protein